MLSRLTDEQRKNFLLNFPAIQAQQQHKSDLQREAQRILQQLLAQFPKPTDRLGHPVPFMLPPGLHEKLLKQAQHQAEAIVKSREGTPAGPEHLNTLSDLFFPQSGGGGGGSGGGGGFPGFGGDGGGSGGGGGFPGFGGGGGGGFPGFGGGLGGGGGNSLGRGSTGNDIRDFLNKLFGGSGSGLEDFLINATGGIGGRTPSGTNGTGGTIGGGFVGDLAGATEQSGLNRLRRINNQFGDQREQLLGNFESRGILNSGGARSAEIGLLGDLFLSLGGAESEIERAVADSRLRMRQQQQSEQQVNMANLVNLVNLARQQRPQAGVSAPSAPGGVASFAGQTAPGGSDFLMRAAGAPGLGLSAPTGLPVPTGSVQGQAGTGAQPPPTAQQFAAANPGLDVSGRINAVHPGTAIADTEQRRNVDEMLQIIERVNLDRRQAGLSILSVSDAARALGLPFDPDTLEQIARFRRPEAGFFAPRPPSPPGIVPFTNRALVTHPLFGERRGLKRGTA